jgi:branched-subunit amino acid ABC-type transport system permease component
MAELLEFLVRGALLGATYGLLAFPMSLLFVTTDTVDLSVGAYAVLAAAVTSVFAGPIGVLLGLVAATAASLVVAVLAQGTGTARRKDPLTIVLMTFGVSTFLESLVLTVFGQNPMVRQPFRTFWNFGLLHVSPQAAINVAVALVLLAALFVWLNHTPYGRDMRACAANPAAAALAGIHVRRVAVTTYAIGGSLAGVAGILILYSTGTSYSAGLGLTITGFGAATILGLHSPLRGFLGGVAIGAVEALCTGYLPAGLGTAGPLLFILVVLTQGKANAGQSAGGRA